MWYLPNTWLWGNACCSAAGFHVLWHPLFCKRLEEESSKTKECRNKDLDAGCCDAEAANYNPQYNTAVANDINVTSLEIYSYRMETYRQSRFESIYEGSIIMCCYGINNILRSLKENFMGFLMMMINKLNFKIPLHCNYGNICIFSVF